MKYLLDTDITSYFLRGKYNLLETFTQKGLDNIRLSIVTVAEMEVLAFKNPSSKINLLNIKQISNEFGVLNDDREIWRIFSETKADLEKSGKGRSNLDILQASIARRHNMILITNNTRHFDDIIEVENWREIN